MPKEKKCHIGCGDMSTAGRGVGSCGWEPGKLVFNYFFVMTHKGCDGNVTRGFVVKLCGQLGQSGNSQAIAAAA